MVWISSVRLSCQPHLVEGEEKPRESAAEIHDGFSSFVAVERGSFRIGTNKRRFGREVGYGSFPGLPCAPAIRVRFNCWQGML